MFKKMRKLSIKSRLFLLITVSTTMIIAVFLLTITWILQEYVIQQTVETTENKVQIVNQSVETFCSTTEGYIRMMSADIRLQDGLLTYEEESKENWLKAKGDFSGVASKTFGVTALTEQIVGGAVFDKEHNLLYKSQKLKDENVSSIVTGEMLTESGLKQKPIWEENLMLLQTTMPESSYNVFPLYKVVRHVDSGKLLGYIVLFVNEESLREIVELSDVFETSSFFVTNQDNQILSTNREDILGKDILEEYKCMVEETGSHLKWDPFPTLHISSKREYNDWKILYVVPMEEVVIQRKTLWSVSIAAMIGILVGIYFCVWNISSKITKPIVDLTKTMHAIEESADMNIRVEGSFQGEMEILSNGFNNLIQKLQLLMKQIYQEQRTKRKLELQLLQAQVNPHFLYNTLETISSLLMLQMKEEAQLVCDSLSEFYKLSLSKGNDMISLEDEFRLLEDYLKIQSIRYVEYMEYYIECEESILDFLVPKLLIQPIVENAIYHGIKQQEVKGMILVNGYQNEENNSIILEVIDTGCGIKEEQLSEIREIIQKGIVGKDSFGLGNVSARLKSVFGNFYRMEINSTSGVSTSVQIEIMKQEEKGEVRGFENIIT